MIVYLDSSIILNWILSQPKSWKKWGKWTEAYTSQLALVEVFRTLDRLRLQRGLSDEEVSDQRTDCSQVLAGLYVLEISSSVVEKASESFPVFVKSLDAIHLATAKIWQGRCPDLVFATHDKQQAVAARAIGLPVEP